VPTNGQPNPPGVAYVPFLVANGSITFGTSSTWEPPLDLECGILNASNCPQVLIRTNNDEVSARDFKMENKMNVAAALKGDEGFKFARPLSIAVILLLGSTAPSVGTERGGTANSPAFSARATHLLGFEGARKNSTGTLSIQDGMLRFQKGIDPAVQVKIGSVQDVFLGDESKQVGGLPMTVGKAAVPFGGGRVVSLFAHKKYDVLSMEYVGSDGGVHGAIFELSTGQGKCLRDQLAVMGARVSRNDQRKQNSVEVSNESK